MTSPLTQDSNYVFNVSQWLYNVPHVVVVRYMLFSPLHKGYTSRFPLLKILRSEKLVTMKSLAVLLCIGMVLIPVGRCTLITCVDAIFFLRPFCFLVYEKKHDKVYNTWAYIWEQEEGVMHYGLYFLLSSCK